MISAIEVFALPGWRLYHDQAHLF